MMAAIEDRVAAVDSPEERALANLGPRTPPLLPRPTITRSSSELW
jgi:hypothetical protein